MVLFFLIQNRRRFIGGNVVGDRIVRLFFSACRFSSLPVGVTADDREEVLETVVYLITGEFSYIQMRMHKYTYIVAYTQLRIHTH